jgi:hypothetical protein
LSGLLHLARLTRIAVAMLGIGTVAHVLGHGQAPHPAAAVVAAIACAQAAALLAAKQRPLLTHLAAMTAVQLGLHVLFVAASDDMGRPMAPATGMFTAHTVAVIVAAWWIRQGDKRAAAFLASAATFLLRHIAPVVTTGSLTHRRLFAASVERRDVRRPLVGYRPAHPRRGPPVTLALGAVA